MEAFIPRTYIDNNTNEKLAFDEIVSKNKISIILGEPASGKTCQLEKYEEENENVELVELQALRIKKIKNKDIILLDSIDEALLSKDKSNLIKDIEEFIKKNKKKKFVITCRKNKFKEYFEERIRNIVDKKEDDKNLKKVDESFGIYNIGKISKKDINKLLKENNIDENRFWAFVKENNLDGLFENILVIKHFINNFDKYSSGNVTYNKIYKEIVKKYLYIKGKYRDEKEELKNIPLEKRVLIVSSLASYLTLNNINRIENDELIKIADELYKIDGLSVSPKELEHILHTGIFNNLEFFHRSIKEFLAANFIYYRKLDFETIKDLFANRYMFYDRYEEVIAFLVSFDNYLFNEIVEFNPFVFKRAFNLTQVQQKVLVENIFVHTQNSFYKDKIPKGYLRDNSLVKIDLPDLLDIIKQNIKIENITTKTYQYILGLYGYNGTDEFRKYILEILEYYLKNNKKFLFELLNSDDVRNINDTFNDDDYRLLLLEFLISNNLLDENLDEVKARIFHTLYGQIDFEKLLPLLKSRFYIDALSYYHNMIQKISNDELAILFVDIYKSSDIKMDDNQLTWLVMRILKDYKYLYNKISLDDIGDFLKKYNVVFKITYTADDIKPYKNIDFNIFGVFDKSVNIPINVASFICHIMSLFKPIENSVEKKQQSLINIDNLELRLNKWIKNQELNLSDDFYLFLRKNIAEVDDNLAYRLKSTFNLNYENISQDIQIVLLQTIAADKKNYEFIKSFWEKDILKNHICFRFMVQADTKKAIKDFKSYIIDKKLDVDIFIGDKEFDIKDSIEKNQIKYLLTSLGYNYKNRKQFNFVAHINDMDNDDIKFIIKTYYECFSPYTRPGKVHRLDDYAVMDWVISSIIRKIDFDRIEILNELESIENNELKKRVKNRMVEISEKQIEEGFYDREYYKNLIDNFEEKASQNEFDFDILKDDLVLCSEKLLKISNKNDFEQEIPLNIKMRTLLETKGYNIAGEDEISDGKSKRDIIVKDRFQSEQTIIEALRIKNNEKLNIKKHYDKLIERYNLLGHRVNYLLIYSNYNNFSKLYSDHMEIYKKSNDYEELSIEKSAIKLGKSFYLRNDNTKGTVYHIFIDFDSKGVMKIE